MTITSLTRLVCFCLILSTLSSFAGRYIYTIGNAFGNTVIGFEIQEDGTLVQLPGSPWETGGWGLTVTPFTQNGLIATEDGRHLFAINILTNNISVFRVADDGTLTQVPGSPFDTGGQVPSCMALSEDVMYVAHLGTNLNFCVECDYRGLRWDEVNETLTPIPDSVIPLPINPPGFVLAVEFAPDGVNMLGARVGDHKIDSFMLDHDSGLLTPAPGSPFDSVITQPLGFAFSPVNDSQVFVSNLVELDERPGLLSSFLRSGSTGQIAPIPGFPYTTGDQGAACWIALTSDGRYLYTTNTRSDTISRYTVNPEGTLNFVEVVDVPKFDEINDEPLDMIITGDDQFLYLVNGGIGGVVGYRILPDGGLELAPGPQPTELATDSAPFGLVYIEN